MIFCQTIGLCMRECRLTVFFPVYISSVFVAKSCVYICVWTKHCVCAACEKRNVDRGLVESDKRKKGAFNMCWTVLCDDLCGRKSNKPVRFVDFGRNLRLKTWFQLVSVDFGYFRSLLVYFLIFQILCWTFINAVFFACFTFVVWWIKFLCDPWAI